MTLFENLDFQVICHGVMKPPFWQDPPKNTQVGRKIIPLWFSSSLDPNLLISAENLILAQEASRTLF